MLAAAYEVDYLEIVVWLDFCFVPHCAWKDIQVVLDGYAVVSHFQKIEQGAYCKAVGDFARVAVYFYDHGRLRRGGGPPFIFTIMAIMAREWPMGLTILLRASA